MNIRLKVYGAVLLAAGLVTAGWTAYTHFKPVSAASDPATGEKEKSSDPVVPVELADAVLGEITSVVNATANLRALREVELAGQADGVVRRVNVEEGDFVRSGDLLCELDDTALQIRLQSAHQKLAQARLQLEKSRLQSRKVEAQISNAREDLERYQKLFDERLVAEREVALLRYKLEELEHDERVASSAARELTHRVEELEAEIEQVQLEITRTRIRAPFSGYIIQRLVELGQTVRNLEPLFRLSDFAPLYAEVHLSESEVGRISQGQSALILLGADLDKRAQGRVARLSPVVDQSTGTVKVTIEVQSGDQALRPGAFVRVEINTERRQDTLLIPRQALLEEDGGQFVFVIDGETARRTTVVTGFQRQGVVEILDGLSTGEKVVVAGQGALKEGAKVKIISG